MLLRCVLLLLGSWATCSPLAAAEGDTLVRLAQAGRIVLGARDSAVPVSYRDPAGAHVGYHLDVCLRIVAAIRQRYDLPALKVVTVPTTLATRFALLNNDSIDIDCGPNAINSASSRQALMAHATFVDDTRILTRKEHAAQPMAWLANRNVGVVVGSTSVPALRMATRNAQFKFTEVPTRTLGELVDGLEQGRLDAVASSAPLLLAQQSPAMLAGQFDFMAGVLRSDVFAIMFRLDDEPLHALANDVIAALMKSGELARLYDKWFVLPVPGLRAPLAQPLPPRLQGLFAEPGSEMRSQ